MSFSSDIKNELREKPVEASGKRAYVRKSFVAWGSCSDPEKTYHMEFNLPNEQETAKLCKILRSFKIKVKRRSNNLVYLKEAENIVTALNIIGAHRAMMAFENVRILKEINNQVNRQVNFETANLGKTVSAAVHQLEDIKLIESKAGLEVLPEPLLAVARLRLTNQDATLKEIGQMLDIPIGKSGVNHRLRKISAIAQELRCESNEGGLF